MLKAAMFLRGIIDGGGFVERPLQSHSFLCRKQIRRLSSFLLHILSAVRVVCPIASYYTTKSKVSFLRGLHKLTECNVFSWWPLARSILLAISVHLHSNNITDAMKHHYFFHYVWQVADSKPYQHHCHLWLGSAKARNKQACRTKVSYNTISKSILFIAEILCIMVELTEKKLLKLLSELKN